MSRKMIQNGKFYAKGWEEATTGDNTFDIKMSNQDVKEVVRYMVNRYKRESDRNTDPEHIRYHKMLEEAREYYRLYQRIKDTMT